MTVRSPAPHKVLRADFERSRYFTVVPVGVALSEVMSSAFWVHVWKQFRANDVIEAVAADGSFDAEFRILSIKADGTMTFRLLRETAAPAVKVASGAKRDVRFETKHYGHGKYRVLDTLSGDVKADGLDKVAAEAEAMALNEAA